MYLLDAIGKSGVATFTAEIGALSKAEELGVFSTLENLGAFSIAEKALPLVEKLRLLSLFESLLEIEAGFTFSIGGFLLAAGPIVIVLQSFAFLPTPKTVPGIGLEAAFDLATLVGGGALLVTAFIISKLQLAADLEE